MEIHDTALGIQILLNFVLWKPILWGFIACPVVL